MAKKTFESALAQLEDIVREMESGELTLEQAVKKYETGMAQTKFCLDVLDKTEKKITQLTRTGAGEPKETLFETEQPPK
ncbi:MAG: exodeoxyribonuclease VII small subunit [Desulfobacterales bacterium]|nr:exodeoxyribonuclease VII small subunit [Desulfobacterales bacterium]